MADEQTIWIGTPSQLTNLKVFLICGLLSFLVVPIFWAIWKWFEVRSLNYELTNQRLRVTSGVFTQQTDDIELYRVKDTLLVQTFFQRMFSLGSVVMITSDRTTPEFVIESVADPSVIREEIRTHVEELRERKRVREVDYE
ncbi:MAG: hypothetical protein CMJ78_06095 [Planctomycetaceae bacterium]|nr:hypothetical protein [Planctomycetaceae bacterium]